MNIQKLGVSVVAGAPYDGPMIAQLRSELGSQKQVELLAQLDKQVIDRVPIPIFN